MRARLVVALCFLSVALFAQSKSDTLWGEISYKTSQNLYVRFSNTEGIQPGDTLYFLDRNNRIPGVVVEHTSSSSCVGQPIGNAPLEVGTKMFFAFAKPVEEVFEPEVADAEPPLPETPVVPVDESDETTSDDISPTPARKTKSRGRISAASYLNISDTEGFSNQRMRYTLSWQSARPAAKGFSAETYMSFRHTLNEWEEVQHNFKRAFKVYNLALRYDVNQNARIWAGRKINLNMSNLGAIDGVQAEGQWRNFLGGAFIGTRPDHLDYGFNPDLLEYGAYVGHQAQMKNGQMASTLAFAEQKNQGLTDRRFIYVQHSNGSIRDIHLFTSFEFDLFTIDNGQPTSMIDMTSLYASIRYRASGKFSVSGSYDTRKNIIYYETYKSFLDQLLEDETRQGFRLNFTFRPFKKVVIGSSGGYRFQKGEPAANRNINSYVTLNRTNILGLSFTASGIFIKTSYLNGRVYGLRLSRDFFKGKVYAEAQLRQAEYRYGSSEYTVKQSIAGLSASWRVQKKLSLSVNYEGEIQKDRTLHRIYSNIVQCF